MIEATGAQIIVELLERQGITTVAGIPGGSVLPLYNQLASSSIRHVLVRHEQAAGFIAQGMARTTGLPAVCIATSGPGAMNLLTAIADARSDSIPLVAITGQVNSSLIGTDAFQEADTFGLSFPITKHSVMVKSVEELLTVIPEAFSIAASGRPGPVLVDIPRDVQTATATFESWPEPGHPQRIALRYPTLGADLAQAIDVFARELLAARKPVLYAGGGCNSPQVAAAIAELLAEIPMAVVSSLMGIGCIDEADQQWCGMVGMHGSMTANTAMYEADLVLAAGVRFDDRATGIVSQFCPNARILHIDIDAAEVNKILPSFHSIVADCQSALPAISQRIRELKLREGLEPGGTFDKSREIPPAHPEDRHQPSPATTDSWLQHLATMYQQEQQVAMGASANDTTTETGSQTINPRRFIRDIPAAAAAQGIDPAKLIVTTDVGQHQMWTAQFYPVMRPRQLLTSGSLGTMGFGLPAALGAALAHPGHRVVCISGDGSIMMNIQELATLAEENLDVTVFVLDNGALGMVRQQQEFLFSKTYSASIYSKRPDLLAIAEGFGIATAQVTTNHDWATVAFPPAGSGPRFIRVPVGQQENVLPFVPAGKKNIEAIT